MREFVVSLQFNLACRYFSNGGQVMRVSKIRCISSAQLTVNANCRKNKLLRSPPFPFSAPLANSRLFWEAQSVTQLCSERNKDGCSASEIQYVGGENSHWSPHSHCVVLSWALWKWTGCRFTPLSSLTRLTYFRSPDNPEWVCSIEMVALPGVSAAHIYAVLLAVLLARTHKNKSAIAAWRIMKTSIWSRELNCEASLEKRIEQRKERRSRLNPELIAILILICGQGQRPSSTPKAHEAWEVLVSPSLWGVICLWGFDLGKWEATILMASTISYQSYFQTSIDYLQGLGPKISCSHCTERSCLSLAVEIYCN